MTPEQAIDEVVNQPTFLLFVQALLEDRRLASKLEHEQPEYWQLGGANGWYNKEVEHFLDAALECYDAHQARMDELADQNPWKYFAEFLYSGKIYE